MNLEILDDGSGADAVGEVEVDVGAGRWESVPLRLTFHAPYPAEPPTVYYRGNRWAPDLDRHLLNDCSFCLWLQGVDQPDVATEAGLEQFLLSLLPFLRDQFVFDDLGEWPGEEWAHGAHAAYSQHLIEVLALADERQLRRLWSYLHGQRRKPSNTCPCGSGRTYENCHQEGVGRLVGLMTQLTRHVDLRPHVAKRMGKSATT
jgi:hypothetical protein